MMKKKVTALLLVFLLAFGLAACGQKTEDTSVEDLVNQGKSYLVKMDYENALSRFEAAIAKGNAEEEIHQLKSILQNFLEAKSFAQVEDWAKAQEKLNLLPDSYIRYSVRDDILALKQQVEEKLTNSTEIDEKLAHLSELINAEKWEEAGAVADELLTLSLSDQQRDKVKAAQETVQSNLSAANKVQDSKKQTYQAKLKAMEEEVANIDEGTFTTVEMKAAAEQRYQKWDKLLNDVYQQLQAQLDTQAMTQLRIEQRKWITHRDDQARKAADEYKGGSAENLVYTETLASVTRERCYRLVEDYMK